MAASDHLHPHQLAMFMPARELFNMPSMDAAGYNGNVETMRRQKRRVNRLSRLPESIKAEGIRKPVQIAHGSDPYWEGHKSTPSAVANGNHRLIAAYDQNPDMEVPVAHYDSDAALMGDMRKQEREKW